LQNDNNERKIVITSDRNLTLRLHKIGVNIMKSGLFYKQYLGKYNEELMEVVEENKENDGNEGIEGIEGNGEIEGEIEDETTSDDDDDDH